jgi:hypothetical protein
MSEAGRAVVRAGVSTRTCRIRPGGFDEVLSRGGRASLRLLVETPGAAGILPTSVAAGKVAPDGL